MTKQTTNQRQVHRVALPLTSLKHRGEGKGHNRPEKSRIQLEDTSKPKEGQNQLGPTHLVVGQGLLAVWGPRGAPVKLFYPKKVIRCFKIPSVASPFRAPLGPCRRNTSRPDSLR